MLDKGDVAVALYNFNGHAESVSLSFTDVGFASDERLKLLDVFGNGGPSLRDPNATFVGGWTSPSIGTNETILLRLLLAD